MTLALKTKRLTEKGKKVCDICKECGGMGHTIGFEGTKKIKYPCACRRRHQ